MIPAEYRDHLLASYLFFNVSFLQASLTFKMVIALEILKKRDYYEFHCSRKFRHLADSIFKNRLIFFKYEDLKLLKKQILQ